MDIQFIKRLQKAEQQIADILTRIKSVPLRFAHGGGVKMIIRASKAELPTSVGAPALGYVNAGTEQGRTYALIDNGVDPKKWISINHLEPVP